MSRFEILPNRHAERPLFCGSCLIQKASLYAAGFHHSGHTDYIGELTGSGRTAVMMLAAPALKVVPVTVHLALAEAIQRLSSDLIVETAMVTAKALAEDFGLAEPRLAVAGLNPHAGEAGSLGREEIEIIEPAILRLRAEGLRIKGPPIFFGRS